MIIKAGVIGDPIAHSLSPKIHNFFLQKYDIKGSYEAIHVKSEELEQKVAMLVSQGFRGFNVTIPHKEKIFALCDEVSQSANLTGAVNTVTIQENGKIFGDNSDVFGFIQNLKSSCPALSLKNKKIGLIGAGGAARAIVHGFILEGVSDIFITNRNALRVENLLRNFAQQQNTKLHFLSQQQFEQHLPSFDLLVNSTSLGMSGQQNLELNLANLESHTIVYDIVYKPLITNLLQHAKQNGNQVVTGIGMLIYQALIGFESWFKVKPEYDLQLVSNLTEISYK